MYGNRTPGNRALPRASKRTNERPRDVTNRIRFFPGPATVAEFLCFYFFSRTLFHPILPMILDRDPLGFPPFYLDDDGTLPRGKSETETLLTRIVANQHHSWNSVIESVPYYSRQTRVCIFPVSRTDDGPAVHPDGSRVSMFLFCFLSLTHSIPKPNRTEPNRTNTIGTIESGEDLGP